MKSKFKKGHQIQDGHYPIKGMHRLSTSDDIVQLYLGG